MKATRDLKKLFAKLEQKGSFSKEDIVSMMSHVRKILEANGKYKSQHPQINLMCNWMLHIKIEGSLVAARALLKVSKAVAETAKQGMEAEETAETMRLFKDAMKKALGFDEIQSGLQAIFEDLKIPTFILSDELWTGVQVYTLQQLVDVPLCFPEYILEGYTGDEPRKLKMKGIYDEIMTLEDPRFQFTELIVNEYKEGLFVTGKSQDENSIKVSLELVRYKN